MSKEVPSINPKLDSMCEMLKTIHTLNERNKILEQENATLKKQLEALSGDIPWNELKDVSEVTKKLTEAKDLLAKWVELYKPKIDTFLPTPIQVDTEQFLNSEVEK